MQRQSDPTWSRSYGERRGSRGYLSFERMMQLEVWSCKPLLPDQTFLILAVFVHLHPTISHFGSPAPDQPFSPQTLPLLAPPAPPVWLRALQPHRQRADHLLAKLSHNYLIILRPDRPLILAHLAFVKHPVSAAPPPIQQIALARSKAHQHAVHRARQSGHLSEVYRAWPERSQYRPITLD